MSGSLADKLLKRCERPKEQFQRSGNSPAATLVFHRRPTSSNAAALPDCHPHTPPFALALEDQLALIEFAQRQGQLSQARQEELATILAPALESAPRGMDAVRFWRGVGAWLLGAR